jgi:hypothetical protein
MRMRWAPAQVYVSGHLGGDKHTKFVKKLEGKRLLERMK